MTLDNEYRLSNKQNASIIKSVNDLLKNSENETICNYVIVVKGLFHHV